MNDLTQSTESHALLNPAQMAVVRSYANGDFAHLAEIRSEDELQTELQNCSDGLLRFLIVELGTADDCDSMSAAITRCSQAIEDIEVVKDALRDLPDASWPRARGG